MIGYTKYSGAGNLFAVADLPAVPENKLPVLAARLCADGGTDGALFCEIRPAAAPRMHYYNADGSRAAFCGNGLRCFARYLADTRRASGRFFVETDSGLMQVQVDEGEVTVQMGRPLLLECPLASLPTGIEKAVFVQMNVPHLVLFARGAVDHTALGQRYVAHPAFKEGTNVDILTGGKDALQVYTWERGAGHTLACGTGCCAAAYAAGIAPGETLQVQAEGGTLRVYRDENDCLWLAGPAERL